MENTERKSQVMNNKAQYMVDNWNRRYPIGTKVTRYKLINPLREGEETETRSEAWLMGGHSAVVLVNGVAGGVLLESLVVKTSMSFSNQDQSTGLTPEMFDAATKLMEERRDALLKLKDAMVSGFGGITKTGTIVDRREHPEATPIPANFTLGIPTPKPIP